MLSNDRTKIAFVSPIIGDKTVAILFACVDGLVGGDAEGFSLAQRLLQLLLLVGRSCLIECIFSALFMILVKLWKVLALMR